MAEHRARLNAPVLIGVGAAFDFHAGLKPQAPAWIQRSGFEWAFRLITEPRRLWKRYIVTIPVFLVAMTAALVHDALSAAWEEVGTALRRLGRRMGIRRMATLSSNTLIVASGEQVSCDLGGETVILSLHDSNYYGLDSVGSFVWKLLQQRRLVQEVCSALLDAFEVTPERCEEDVLALLGNLADRGLIQVIDAAAA